MLANTLFHFAWMGFAKDDNAVLTRGRTIAERAVRLNPSDESAHWILGMFRLRNGEHDGAIAAMEQAIEINPNYAHAYGSLATVLNFAGDPERSIENNQIALRSNPRDPSNFYRYCGLAISHLLLGRLEDGMEWACKTVHVKTDWFLSHVVLIAYLVGLGQMDEAKAAMRDFRVNCPETTIADIEKLPFRRTEHLATLVDAVRKVQDT